MCEPNVPGVDLSLYDSVFDAVSDLKGDWTVESYYHPLHEGEKDGQEERDD